MAEQAHGWNVRNGSKGDIRPLKKMLSYGRSVVVDDPASHPSLSCACDHAFFESNRKARGTAPRIGRG